MSLANFPVYQNPQSDGSAFHWKGSSTGILLIHGFTATTTEVRLFAEALRPKGYTISAPVLPGHNATIQDLHKTRMEDWLGCVEKAYLELASACSACIVAGESLGGLLSLYLASKYPEIRGILLFAPAISVPSLHLAPFVAPFVRYRKKKNIDLNSPWKGYNVVPMRAAVELLRTQRLIKSRLSQVAQPALIFQGMKDGTINPEGARLVYDGIQSNYKDLIILENAHHCILLDGALPEVVERSNRFIHQYASIS